jgi:hypothetical protein
MKKLAIFLAMATFVIPTIANAVVINFDNLGTNMQYVLQPNIPPFFGILEGFKFGAVGGDENRVDVINTETIFGFSSQSGSYSLLNNVYGDAVVTEQDGNVFSFQSVYASTLPNYSGNTGQRSIVGYLDGTEVGSITFNLADNWQQVTGNLSNIDKLVFELTYDGTHGFYLLDNLVLNESSSVPEPSALLLLGSGLVGLIAGRKMFRRHDA